MKLRLVGSRRSGVSEERRRSLLFKMAALFRDAATLSCLAAVVLSASAQTADLKALRLAIEDLQATFGERYANGPQFAKQLAELEKLSHSATQTPDFTNRVAALRQQALLANPLLNFDRLLLVRRSTKHANLGLPQNWQGNCAMASTGYDDEIAVLSPITPAGKLASLFKPGGTRFVGDVDLHFSADRMLFSMPEEKKRWAIWELRADGTGLRQVSPKDEPDVDWYDPCYLPDGRILFAGTACMAGVPCVSGGNKVANLYLLDPATGKLRQVTFDQEHNWCPTVLNNGRVLYSRWEYTDSPHYFTRLLFHMNPDGTGQMEFYGSNSYWPNSIFYARPIPGCPTKVVAVISGHHGVPRMGELIVFDPAKSRHEASGAMQRIPGRGKPVQPVIADQLVQASWPRFLHPYPLSEKYFIVSCQPAAGANWGLYLADVFDNLVLIHETPGSALFEPLPLRPTPAPPVIPDKVNLAQSEATVLVQDIYAGPGLAGVPRGTVKKLRVFEYHFAYPQMGGHINIGIDGPWDVHRILGTVPVNEDGSASFRVPANRPLAVQPLDAEGKALQVMRSWFTAMPGETVSCVGCHEAQNSAVAPRANLAATAQPSRIEEWYGPARGFSFAREVQPVLDKHCVGCHDGEPRQDGKTIPDLTGDQPAVKVATRKNAKPPKKNVEGFEFDASYVALHPFVRRPGPESDYHIQVPGEWHADTSELVQMLKAGHHGVQLDAESWDRLITWIDLNVPDHGTWTEHRPIPGNFHQRRQELLAKYANRTDDPEVYPATTPVAKPATPLLPKNQPPTAPAAVVTAAGWPFDAATAKRRQSTAGPPTSLKIPLGAGAEMEFVLIPTGEFVSGDSAHQLLSRIEKPFYLGACEVSNEQFAKFDPAHDSGYISEFNKDQSNRGQPANRPNGAVIRVSWDEAMAYCQWLSARTGRRFTLPTETQWEWACRAGTATPWNFGANGHDFSRAANLADQRLLALCRGNSPKWIPAVETANDGAAVVDQVGRYQPNAWGLRDMHGNAAEWTLTDDAGRKVVRGGSFYDRPERATSFSRVTYPSWRKVFNTGFRVLCEVTPAEARQMAAAR